MQKTEKEVFRPRAVQAVSPGGSGRLAAKLNTILLLCTLLVSCMPGSDRNKIHSSSTLVSASSAVGEATEAPAVTASVHFQCIQVLASRPGNLEVSGRIILRDYRGSGALFALDPINGQTTEILHSIGPHTIAALSPSQQLLAYRDKDSTGKGDVLAIVDTHFALLKSIPWQASWLAIVNWLNEKEVVLLSADPTAQMTILDSITDHARPITFRQLPDFSNSVTHPWAEFDPSEQRVLYPITGSAYSLFDLASKRSIARLQSWTAEVPDASWSTDGSIVAVIGPSPQYYDNLGGSDEIFGVSRDGQVQQMTHLASYYGRNLALYSPRWSPDRTRLAFWVRHPANGTTDYVLAVLDATTHAVTNLCISTDPSGYGGDFNESLPPPIWSPDSRQIAVEDRYSKDHSRVVLVDLWNHFALEIAQDSHVVGWMLTGP